MAIIGGPLSLSERAIRDAKLYTGTSDPVDAIERLVDSYGTLLADVRQLRRRVSELDQEHAEIDLLINRLQALARDILDI